MYDIGIIYLASMALFMVILIVEQFYKKWKG